MHLSRAPPGANVVQDSHLYTERFGQAPWEIPEQMMGRGTVCRALGAPILPLGQLPLHSFYL